MELCDFGMGPFPLLLLEYNRDYFLTKDTLAPPQPVELDPLQEVQAESGTD